MSIYLAIQTTFDNIEIGLYNNTECIEVLIKDKKTASKYIVLYIDQLLRTHKRTIDDITFIAINRGPAPFTSLRVAIATVNGISFASKVQLVGVDGLRAFLNEHQQSDNKTTIALLNAFSGDIYFGIMQQGIIKQTGWNEVHTFLKEQASLLTDEPVRFIGHGVQLYRSEIEQYFGKYAIIQETLPEYASIDQIAKIGFDQWSQKKEISNEVLPLYLKTLRYKVSIPA